MKNKVSITQILLIFSIVFVIVFLGLFTYLGLQLSEERTESFGRKYIKNNTELLASEAAYAIVGGDQLLTQDAIASFEKVVGILNVKIYDSKFTDISSKDTQKQPDIYSQVSKPTNQLELKIDDDSVLKIWMPIRLENNSFDRGFLEEESIFSGVIGNDAEGIGNNNQEILGWVGFDLDLQEIEPGFHNRVLWIPVVLAVSTTIFVLLILSFLLFLIKPLKNMATAVKKGDFTEVRNVMNSTSKFQYYELAEVAEGFTNQLNTIETVNAGLEEKISERTRTLEDLNSELRGANSRSEKLLSRNRDLLQHLDREIESDRKFVSSEIHDTLCTRITKIFRICELAENEIDEGGSQVKSLVSEARDEAVKTNTLARNIIRRMRTEVIEMLGLEKGIEELISYWNGAEDCKTRFSILGSSRNLANVDRDHYYAVSMIIQEALKNIYKHANASEGLVKLADTEEGVRITISDNGVGFADGDTNNEVSGFGLSIMEERAITIGAGFKVESGSENASGTKLFLEIPVKNCR